MDELGVEYRTTKILYVKKVLTKKILVTQLEEKRHNLEIIFSRFFNRIKPLTNRELPSLFVINDKLITREDYANKLKDIAKDTTKFVGVRGAMTGRSFLEAMSNDIFIEHEIKHIFVLKPTFSRFTEIDEIY